MNPRWLSFLAVLALFSPAMVQAGRLDGEYVGDARAKISGQRVSVPFSFKIKRQRLKGNVLVPGANRIVKIKGSVNQGNGRFVGFVTIQNGITGMFVGNINRRKGLKGNGTLNVPGFGSVRYSLRADSPSKGKSPFKGTWVATHPPTQSVIRTEVFVSPGGIATLYFHTSVQTITDNREVSPDGQINSVINNFTYFVRLNRNGTFTVNYQGALGIGNLTGKRTTMGGVRATPKGTYTARSTVQKEPFRTVKFVVKGDRSLAGFFKSASNAKVKFTNIVGDLDDFTGTAEDGTSYFAKIGADGSFTLNYQTRTLQRGAFSGKRK